MILFVFSCNSQDETKTRPSLLISGDGNIGSEGGECKIFITSSADWFPQVEKDSESWLNIKMTEKDFIIVSVTPNTLGEPRLGQIIIKLNKYNELKLFTITQKAAHVIKLIVEPKNISVPGLGGDFIIDIVTGNEVQWDYEIEKKENWISEKARATNSITFNLEKNNVKEERNCKIIFTNKSSQSDIVTVKVTQEACTSCDNNGDNPIENGYVLQSSMQGSSFIVDKDYTQIHSYMKQYGWDYSEHPNSSSNDHSTGIHCQNIYDDVLKQYVFKFIAHIDPVLDGDRGSLIDRQRNEMKSQTSNIWYKMNGNWGEKQVLEWKFKIPKGFRPSTSFCHIHQLKAQEGNNGAPIITITLRGNNNGTNKRVQVIHTGDVSATNKGIIADNISIEEFEDEWVQVQEEVYYTHNGFFRIKVTRLRDNKVLINHSENDIDMWRKGATNIRNKFGIYRSYGRTLINPDDRPSNGIKDEILLLGDFYIYEKDTNPNPQPHD